MVAHTEPLDEPLELQEPDRLVTEGAQCAEAAPPAKPEPDPLVIAGVHWAEAASLVVAAPLVSADNATAQHAWKEWERAALLVVTGASPLALHMRKEQALQLVPAPLVWAGAVRALQTLSEWAQAPPLVLADTATQLPVGKEWAQEAALLVSAGTAKPLPVWK